MFAAHTSKNVPSLDTNGIVTSFALDIEPEDFDIIQPNQDLYCVDYPNNAIVKFSRTLFTNYWGDLLITQEGTFDPGTHPPKLFIVHWDSTNSVFNTRSLSCSGGPFEHVTFAPINIPDL